MDNLFYLHLVKMTPNNYLNLWQTEIPLKW